MCNLYIPVADSGFSIKQFDLEKEKKDKEKCN